jgi:hypothetical protein
MLHREARGGTRVSETAIFERYLESMLRICQVDADRARLLIRARGDQVMAALRDALQPGGRDSDRTIALIDLYLHTTLEMLYEAAQFEDRIGFAEAEMKAWAVVGALDRAADAVRAGDKDTMLAAMMAAESVLGINLSRP